MLLKQSKWKLVLAIFLVLNLTTSCENQQTNNIPTTTISTKTKENNKSPINICTSPIKPIELTDATLLTMSRSEKENLVLINCVLAVKCGYNLPYRNKCETTLLYLKPD